MQENVLDFVMEFLFASGLESGVSPCFCVCRARSGALRLGWDGGLTRLCGATAKEEDE
jgi:hypothetical protein